MPHASMLTGHEKPLCSTLQLFILSGNHFTPIKISDTLRENSTAAFVNKLVLAYEQVPYAWPSRETLEVWSLRFQLRNRNAMPIFV